MFAAAALDELLGSDGIRIGGRMYRMQNEILRIADKDELLPPIPRENVSLDIARSIAKEIFEGVENGLLPPIDERRELVARTLLGMTQERTPAPDGEIGEILGSTNGLAAAQAAAVREAENLAESEAAAAHAALDSGEALGRFVVLRGSVSPKKIERIAGSRQHWSVGTAPDSYLIVGPNHGQVTLDTFSEFIAQAEAGLVNANDLADGEMLRITPKDAVLLSVAARPSLARTLPSRHATSSDRMLPGADLDNAERFTARVMDLEHNRAPQERTRPMPERGDFER